MRICSRALALAWVAVFLPAGLHAQAYNPIPYWVMPQGLLENFTQINSDGTQAFGQKGFWSGTLWGRSVALAGIPSSGNFGDVFVYNGNNLEYWGTAQGNQYALPRNPSEYEQGPCVFLGNSMTLGQVISTTITGREMDGNLRKNSNTAPGEICRVALGTTHYDSWTDPDSGIMWSDVLQFTFWSNYNPNNTTQTRENYYLANGYGYVHFDSPDRADGFPQKAYVTSYVSSQPQATIVPAWYDAVNYATYVPNGFIQDFLSPPPPTGCTIATCLRSWTSYPANPNAGVVTTDGTYPPDIGTPAQLWKIALVANGQGAAAAWPYACVPVVAGGTYTLSGWIWRVSDQDNAYLDFNQGTACSGSGSFTPAYGAATSTNTWEFQQATVTIPSGVTGITTRVVRDGANVGNAYFVDVTLQRNN